jgi:hypothetical protein
VRRDERRTLLIIVIAGVVGAILIMPAIYVLGLWLAPPRPVPSSTRVPDTLSDALWARADGGPVKQLRPINPLTFVEMRVCRYRAAAIDDPIERGQRRAECMKLLPAIQAADYLSGVHMRDSNAATGGFREGISQFSTAAWVTRSWTAEELLDTLAERGDFGFGWRGADAGAHGYFGRDAGAPSIPQAALLAALIGDRGIDPWCNATSAIEIRRQILEHMRDNTAIVAATFESADRSPLGLADPPPQHHPCPQ